MGEQDPHDIAPQAGPGIDPRPVRALVAVERVVSVVLMAALAGLTLFQIVSRYVLATPFPWTEELARYSMVWLTFVSAALVMSQGRHIAVTAIGDRFGGRVRIAMYVFAHLLVVAVCVVLLTASREFIEAMGRIRAPASRLPMSVVYGASTVGFALLGLHALVNAVLALRHGEAALKEATPAEGV
jgi:TRAP-type transport system small permease protein